MRFSPMIEGAVYFTISEALTNIAKYAEASGALVRADCRDDQLTVEITDDGIGGADATVGNRTPGPGRSARSRSTVRSRSSARSAAARGSSRGSRYATAIATPA